MTSVTQTEFRAAVFDPNAPRPDGLSNGDGAPAGKRFDVYRNNVIVSLKEAMRTGFPVVEKLLGAENFGNLTGLFVRANPPSDPRLAHYGQAFPEFLKGFEPLQHLGYLPDVARLELALRESYNAADAALLDPAALGSVPPERLPDAMIDLTPGARIVTSDWPIHDIWHFNMTPDAPKPRDVAQDVLVTRPEFDPIHHVLPKGAATLLTLLSKGQNLGAALEAAHEDEEDFDFGETLSLLLQSGALSALRLPDPN